MIWGGSRIKISSSVKIRTWRLFHKLWSWSKQIWCREINLLPVDNRTEQWKTTSVFKNIFPHPPSSTSSPQAVQRNGVCSQPVTLHLWHSFMVTPCLYSRVCSPQTDSARASHSSSTTALTWLQLYTVGSIFYNCTVPPCAALHRLPLCPGASPRWVATGCGSFRLHPLLPVDSSMAACGYLPHVVTIGCRGTICYVIGLYRELLLCTWSTVCPSSALMSVVAGLLLFHFSLPSPRCCYAAVF